jgi:hypothetical protein
MLLAIEVAAYAFTTWLGLYLVQRNPADPRLRFAGLGSLAYALALGVDVLAENAPSSKTAASLALLRGLLLFAPALFWALAVFHLRRRLDPSQPPRLFGVSVVATLFFGLGLALWLVPLNWIPRAVLLPSIGLDFALLGYAVAGLNAFEEGEAFLPDMLRAFGGAAFAVLLFGSLVVITMSLAREASFLMLGLLLATTACAIATQLYADSIQGLIDRLTLARFPRIRRERTELRAAASALPRVDQARDPALLDEAEFERLTRRAISHMGDLARLAASPLTRLPLVGQRLARRGLGDDTIERAMELKVLLAESIGRLKPRDNGDFGTTDAWRHYNALHFPYVLGLKPYSRRLEYNGLEPAARDALEWFRTQVPERTLHNWQTAAARLVARDLREKNAQAGSDWQ